MSTAALKMDKTYIFSKAPLLIIAILIIILYSATFSYLKHMYTYEDTFYSHGFLVPLVTGFLIWAKKKELVQTEISTSRLGLVLIVVSLLFHLFGVWWQINFVSVLSLVVLVWSLVLYFCGAAVFRKIFFPLVFLLFAVPFPWALTAFISFRMKIYATIGSVNTLNFLGIETVRKGAIILLPNTFLEVGNPCSGLRSLISLLALGSVYSYLLPAPVYKKWIMFICSAPLALMSNIVRIVFTSIIAHVYGREIATGFLHDFSGYMVFAVALIGLFLIGRVLTWKRYKEDTS